MTDVDARLARLGAALHTAAAADLAAAGEGRRSVRRRAGRSTRAKVGVALVVTVLAVPAGALAIDALSPGQKLARGLPGGTDFLAGTEPTCSVVRRGVEYDCVLAKPPHAEVPPREAIYIQVPGAPSTRGAPGHWRGFVVDTIDAGKHVNGGCRAVNPDGTHWRCYLGEAAVRHQLIAQHLLGRNQGGPLDYFPLGGD